MIETNNSTNAYLHLTHARELGRNENHDIVGFTTETGAERFFYITKPCMGNSIATLTPTTSIGGQTQNLFVDLKTGEFTNKDGNPLYTYLKDNKLTIGEKPEGADVTILGKVVSSSEDLKTLNKLAYNKFSLGVDKPEAPFDTYTRADQSSRNNNQRILYISGENPTDITERVINKFKGLF